MKKYEVVVAYKTLRTYDSKEEAERGLYEARHSYLAMVHPKDMFWIREKKS